MSGKKKNIQKEVMDAIKHDDVSMHSHNYFFALNILVVLSTVALASLAIILANLLFPVTEREFIPSLEEELHNDASSSLAEEKSNPEIAEQSIENIPQEVYYRCQVICPAENEIEVLALLVQLSKEQKLVVIGISSKKLANNQSLPEVEIEVDFVCDSNNNQSELEEVLYQLKSKVEVSASSWLCLSSQLPNINESGDYRQQTPAQAYSENQRFKV